MSSLGVCTSTSELPRPPVWLFCACSVRRRSSSSIVFRPSSAPLQRLRQSRPGSLHLTSFRSQGRGLLRGAIGRRDWRLIDLHPARARQPPSRSSIHATHLSTAQTAQFSSCTSSTRSHAANSSSSAAGVLRRPSWPTSTRPTSTATIPLDQKLPCRRSYLLWSPTFLYPLAMRRCHCRRDETMYMP